MTAARIANTDSLRTQFLRASAHRAWVFLDASLILRGFCLLLSTTGLVFPLSRTFAEDTVVVSRLDGSGESRRKGTILDYTGTALTLRIASGREEQILSARILGYETELVPDQQNGDQLFAAGRYADAIVSYTKAIKVEQRTWVRREILAQLVRCYTNLQQHVRAGETFLLIIRSDPATQLLSAIPLAWKPTQPPADLSQSASRWMENRDLPIARLIGASWLLSTSNREQALAALSELTSDPDPRIAMLAETQQWRDQIVTATAQQAELWQEQLLRLDTSLRAGPFFLVGQTLARHGKNAEAALAFMRVAIMHPVQSELAAESLFAAGEQLEKLGNSGGAQTVYRELVQKHPKHPLTAVAEQNLARMAPK